MKNGKLPLKHGKTVFNEIMKFKGGFHEVARICRRTPKAVRNWAELNRLPRTELTGETHYAELMFKANPEIDKEGLVDTARVKRKRLRQVNRIGRPVYQ